MDGFNQQNKLTVKTRRRQLTVTSLNEEQKSAMNSSIDNLQNDLDLIRSQWHNVLTKDTNPLETALAFLDTTSVGLGYRYNEFNQLENTLGNHLKDVVNEHCQAFNSNVASYSKTVSALTDAQERTTRLKKEFKIVSDLIIMQKGSLEELDQKYLQYTNLLSSLSQIEELMKIPELIEDNIRRAEYRSVQKLIQRSFIILSSPNIKPLKQLASIRQQIELQEHILFENIIQDIQSIIYCKKGLPDIDSNILKTISISQNGFTSLENYLFNIANIDINKQSEVLNENLKKFIKLLNDNDGFQQTELIKESNPQQSEYYRIFDLLSLMKGTNRLPATLSILTDRTREEIHNIIVKSMEQVRIKHPTLVKIVNNSVTEDTFGPSVNQLFSLVMRECFWEIFLKLLTAVQGHRVIFEIITFLQNSQPIHSIYRFDTIIKKILDEVKTLLHRYLVNTQLSSNNQNISSKDRNIKHEPEKKHFDKIFSLQDNIEMDVLSKQKVSGLKSLLKDIFLGFTVDSNINLDNIYLEDDSFEQEEPLIPPSVFNMKVILEPFLLFSQASSDLIPPTISAKESVSPLIFFNQLMEDTFYPKLKDTLNHLFISKVETSNRFSIETINDTRIILKSAFDFQKLFYNQISILNASNMFRPDMISLLLEILSKFFQYTEHTFNIILDGSDKNLNKNLLKECFTDYNLIKIEESIVSGNSDSINMECDMLYQHYMGFYSQNNHLTNNDHLNEDMFESLVYLSSTLNWIESWLPMLSRTIDSSKIDNLDDVTVLTADQLRKKWSFFEYSDVNTLDNKNINAYLLLNDESLIKFNDITHGFHDLNIKSLILMRLVIRSRCIYKIAGLFNSNKDWNLEVSSNEIDSNIATLLSDLRRIEDKLNKQNIEGVKDIVFSGIDVINDMLFIKGSRSISVINQNGLKKIERNIDILQHGIRNMYHERDTVKISNNNSTTKYSPALDFYHLVGSNENDLINRLKADELSIFSSDDVKTILRLQFSEEFAKQNKRASAMAGKSLSLAKPLNRRYDTALKTIESLLK